jgi:tetratricopeptide (TPR) repeat protein
MRKFTIFISSTIEDLREERLGIDQELRFLEVFEPVRVEILPASEETSRHVCLREVAEADALVLILKDRYGYVPQTNNPDRLSVTHLEYREAKRLNKPVFVFILDGAQSEPELASFIQEVSDFNEGVLRKKWRTTLELCDAARRALLYWIAKRARETKSDETHRQAQIALGRDAKFSRLAIVLEIAHQENQIEHSWCGTLFEQLAHDCQRRYLPTPQVIQQRLGCHDMPSLGLQISVSMLAGRMDLSVQVIDQELPIPAPLIIDAAVTDEGARFAARCSLALVLLLSDDWSGAIDQLLKVSMLRSTSSRSRMKMLANAAQISTLNRGRRIDDIVEQMLKVRKLDSQTVGAGVIALAAAELRLEFTRAQQALANTEKLALRLLTWGLTQEPTAADCLYNLARQSFRLGTTVTLAFYNKLLRVDPSYEERWYFHRDLGLIHYGHRSYRSAAEHYDRAWYLKDDDSELFRMAGDAHYYRGWWADALLRYQRALSIEPIESYFLDAKVEFCKAQMRKGSQRNASFRRKCSLSHRVSVAGVRAAEAERKWLARTLLRIAKGLCELSIDFDRWLALYANRRGAYAEAAAHLRGALAVVPEDPSIRLNLVVNLIFQNGGQFDDGAINQAKIAIFHGGPETLDQFRLRLTYTENSEKLCEEFRAIFEVVQAERDEWIERRRKILKPAIFGRVMHCEFRS